jgi:pyruvate dehydrogenase (quinone)
MTPRRHLKQDLTEPPVQETGAGVSKFRVARHGCGALTVAGQWRIWHRLPEHPGLSLRKNKQIEWLHVRHEEVAAFAAGAEAHLTGEILNSARKVTILGGAGCAGAHAELLAVAERLKAPIVHALRGKEFIEYDNPYDVGMTGLLGFSSGYHAMMNCDALLMLGTDFPYQQFYPKNAKIIQVDRLGGQIGRRTPVDLGLVGNVKDTLEVLTPLIQSKSDRSYLDTCVNHYKDARKGLDDLAVGEPGRTPIHPQYVAKVLDELAAEDAVFTCDVGTPTVWAARYLHMNGKRRLLGSFSHGSMANALPQAIGIQASHPGRQVITLSGDGGLAMLLGDLLTLRQLQLPIKVVVFNNSSLGFVELEMKAAGLVDYGTDLVNPNFSKLAESADIFGVRVEKPEELRPALTKALAHKGPALIEVLVNRQELSMPPTISIEQALGFSLYMIRAVLSGRGDEVIDLAKSNLLR